MPILDGERPLLVIAPATPDLQIAPCEPLLAEARAAYQRDRSCVPGLDARLDPVEVQVAERVTEHELQPFPHVPVAGEGLERVVAEVCVAELPVEDLAESEVADDRAVVVAADHQTRIGVSAVSHVVVERLPSCRRIRPGTMQDTRRMDEPEELGLVVEQERADVYVAAPPA